MKAFLKILALHQFILCAGLASGSGPPGKNAYFAEQADRSGRPVGELVNLLMKEAGGCKESGGCSGDELQAFVLNLQPEKRKAFTDLLSIVLKRGHQGPSLSSENEELKIFTLPPGEDVRELVRYIVGSVRKEPAGEEPDYLRNVIMSEKKAAIDKDPSLNETINNLITDLKARKLGIYNFA